MATTTPHIGYWNFRDKHKSITTPVTDYGEYASNNRLTIHQKGYAAMHSSMDRDIGGIVHTLKRLKIDGKTIVLVIGDNGPQPFDGIIQKFDANAGLRGWKRTMFDGGLRSPGIVRWPGHIPANSKSDYPWKSQYLLPTFTKLAGKEVSKPGTQSVSDIWLGTDAAADKLPIKTMHFEYCDMFKVRKGRRKRRMHCGEAHFDLNNWPRQIIKDVSNPSLNLNGPRERYELISDPYEKNNLLDKSYISSQEVLRNNTRRLRA